MNKTFRLFGLLYSVYPFKQFLLKRVVDYFFEYHIGNILNNASRAYKISDYENVVNLKNKAPFRGLMKDIFKSNEFYPSPKDIATVINISINAFCNESHVNKNVIIDLSYHLSSEIKERILSDNLLKRIFSDLGKNPKLLTDTGNRKEIKSLFDNKKELFVNYYSLFNDNRFNYKIKIWHQSEKESWVDFKNESSIIVNIDPAKIREGFFLVGFDYSRPNGDSLTVASRINGYEYFNHYENTNDIIWAW